MNAETGKGPMTKAVWTRDGYRLTISELRDENARLGKLVEEQAAMLRWAKEMIEYWKSKAV
jgi:hypothetical protein